MNVLEVLATTSILFVVFAIVWVVYVEEWLEQRELSRTQRRRNSSAETSPEGDTVEQTQQGGS
ncbi:hypothetical protein [Salinadaptatus halalkaliphilus]|uniref:hypothetical protein n=1 Tax=Salinadaptatus halalkaliphilus TaxID=2419781 RepID=UPI0011414249|nr:hypothetical protein [Salinadaptatus halalkaliphilus]